MKPLMKVTAQVGEEVREYPCEGVEFYDGYVILDGMTEVSIDDIVSIEIISADMFHQDFVTR